MTADEEAFAHYLRWNFRLEPGDVVPTDTPGYWRKLEACEGRYNGCGNPVHHGVGSEGPIYHTIHYYDSDRDERGRFRSPYRTWRAASARCMSTTVHQISSLLEIAGRPATVLDNFAALRQMEEALR